LIMSELKFLDFQLKLAAPYVLRSRPRFQQTQYTFLGTIIWCYIQDRVQNNDPRISYDHWQPHTPVSICVTSFPAFGLLTSLPNLLFSTFAIYSQVNIDIVLCEYPYNILLGGILLIT
jgi:hypothetical protein